MFGEYHDEWFAAMRKEVFTLEEMSCWDTVSRHKDKRVFHTKFVLKRKTHSAGEKSNSTMRFVVRGNGKYEDEEDTFTPVSYFTVIKLVLCMAEHSGYHHRHFDFHNAFQNGKLDCLVYAELPKPIFINELRAIKCVRLRRSLYVLKDGAGIWYELLKSQLAEAHLVQSKRAPRTLKF